ncbi:unnamed protein product [Scytosiphon promiscuus]
MERGRRCLQTLARRHQKRLPGSGYPSKRPILHAAAKANTLLTNFGPANPIRARNPRCERGASSISGTTSMAGLATAILRGLTTHEHLDDLLSRGIEVADPSFVDPLGRSLIHVAADAGDVSALRWLLSHGADPKQTTTAEGNTALHLAAGEGYQETVAFLLEEACVGVAGVNGAGQTALDVAVEAGHQDIVRLLTRHLPVTPPPPPPPTNAAGAVRSVPAAPAPAVISELPAIKARGRSSRHPETAPLASKNAGIMDAPSPSPGAQTTKSGTPQPSDAAVGRKAVARTPSPKGAHPRKTGGGGGGRFPFDERALTEGGFFVAGAWSKAGVCSCFNVRHRHLLGKHGVVFDMGVCPSQVLNVAHVFVTHGHLDHCGAIVSHARLRALSQGPPAKYYMGAELAAGMEKVRKAFEEVEGAGIAMDIVAVGPDDRIDLGQGCFVRPFSVMHRVDAMGFALIRRKTEGLKDEYRGMDGKEIGVLKKRGVDVSQSREIVEVVYTGDTVMDGLVTQPLVWQARLLIMEVTYLDGDGKAAAKNFHIHVQDLLENMEKLEGVERLVVAHVSERHGSHRNILRLLKAALPPSVANKVSVALGEFGAPQHLSFLEDYIPGETPPRKGLPQGGVL